VTDQRFPAPVLRDEAEEATLPISAGELAFRPEDGRSWHQSQPCQAGHRGSSASPDTPGEVLVRYQDGTETTVHFFASRLKYSRWIEVTLVRDERVETLVPTLVDHLAAFGGIPLVAVFDRPKTVALKCRVESDVCRRRAGLGDRRGSVLALPAAAEGQRRESRRLGQGLVFQAASISRSGGSRAAAARVAHRGQHRPAVAGHRRTTGDAHRRGAGAPAAAEDRAGRLGPADARERRADRRGDP